MLFFLSPAKTLDFEAEPKFPLSSVPVFLQDSAELIDVLKRYTPSQLSVLMGLSDSLAQLNVARYTSWKKSRSVNISRSAKQACYAFKGDVYVGLDAEQFKKRELEYAQQHLRILSGLYGLLKPLDVINPHRLEMGTRLVTDKGKDLYHFWDEKITDQINAELKAQKSDVVVNLASNEYFKSIKKHRLEANIITPVFKDEKAGQFKVISFFAKKARGMMAAYAIQNRLKCVEDLKSFTSAGYYFNEAVSTDKEWIFYREAQS